MFVILNGNSFKLDALWCKLREILFNYLYHTSEK